MKTGILHFDELPEILDKLGFPNDIPICEGQHRCYLDVREELLDPELIQARRDQSNEERAKKGKPPAKPDIPLGVDWDAIERNGGKIIWDDE